EQLPCERARRASVLARTPQGGVVVVAAFAPFSVRERASRPSFLRVQVRRFRFQAVFTKGRFTVPIYWPTTSVHGGPSPQIGRIHAPMRFDGLLWTGRRGQACAARARLAGAPIAVAGRQGCLGPLASLLTGIARRGGTLCDHVGGLTSPEDDNLLL
ncbi:unnamed protein product, partial [Prorocentrum cordatum]